MKKKLLVLVLFINAFSFAQSEAIITWENCSTEGNQITNELMSNNSNLYEQILVLVIHKSKTLGYSPSSNWIHREINRQCFALRTIGQWIGVVGGVESTAYKKRVESNLSEHMVWIPEYYKMFNDHGSLHKAEFLSKE